MKMAATLVACSATKMAVQMVARTAVQMVAKMALLSAGLWVVPWGAHKLLTIHL